VPTDPGGTRSRSTAFCQFSGRWRVSIEHERDESARRRGCGVAGGSRRRGREAASIRAARQLRRQGNPLDHIGELLLTRRCGPDPVERDRSFDGEVLRGCAGFRSRARQDDGIERAGRQLDEPLVEELATEPQLTLLCGRYEGFDERVIEHFVSGCLSIGRYVLAGGELAAMVVLDALVRKLPGALGDASSPVEESFSAALEGAPEYPHYTRPAEYRGWRVPDILLSGHHARIREWRLAQSRSRALEGG